MGNIIVGGIVVVCLIGAITVMIKNKKKGGCSGCGDCSACARDGVCHSQGQEIE